MTKIDVHSKTIAAILKQLEAAQKRAFMSTSSAVRCINRIRKS